ncbi:MAG: 30S ribosomal protein S15 [Candidatus Lightella neohaematopini]|nr:30S ribosomal protein S15 [Candidatus Lightella neohaematopini]MCV2528967.1 30S ribosomal protein S15 [Candidatus Lightella neohaematopini]
MYSYYQKKKIIINFGKSEKDSGLTEVQVALLSQRINKLKQHFLKHSKDYHSKRGLLSMVNKRRKLLNYLKKISTLRYNKLVKSLKLR